MCSITDFIYAALPWIAIGISIVLITVNFNPTCHMNSHKCFIYREHLHSGFIYGGLLLFSHHRVGLFKIYSTVYFRLFQIRTRHISQNQAIPVFKFHAGSNHRLR